MGALPLTPWPSSSPASSCVAVPSSPVSCCTRLVCTILAEPGRATCPRAARAQAFPWLRWGPGCRTGGLKTDARPARLVDVWTGGGAGLIFKSSVSGFKMVCFECVHLFKEGYKIFAPEGVLKSCNNGLPRFL